MNIKTIMRVSIGGFLGGITRYELSVLLGGDGILYANLIGSFLLAFITYYFIEGGAISSMVKCRDRNWFYWRFYDIFKFSYNYC